MNKTFRGYLSEAKLHPKAVHVSAPVDGKHTVQKLGAKVKNIKVGEKLTSTNLDDLKELGHKVKETK